MGLTVAHLSDIHCGDPHFVPDLMERAIAEINDLAPDIVVAILNGRQPVALTASKLMADTRLPLDWSGQRKALGFA